MSESVRERHAMRKPGLPLASFKVTGFRTFRELQIPELRRVNLFVGENNVGKTTLLEAFQLYAAGATSDSLANLLSSRGDLPPEGGHRQNMTPELLAPAVDRIFHQDLNGNRDRQLALGPDSVRELRVERGWIITSGTGEPRTMEFSATPSEELLSEQDRGLRVRVGDFSTMIFRDTRLLRRAGQLGPLRHLLPSSYVPALGMLSGEIAAAWDRIALTDAEDLILDALRIIAPALERLSLVGDVDIHGGRQMVARLQAQPGPVPLRALGDGMNRLLEIALALVTAAGGILLVDEIENGLHYSVQADVWRMVIRAAESLNVQVFATTHSWDCIRAFAAATAADDAGAAMLYRLDRRREGEVRAVQYSAEEVGVAADQEIEVR